MGSTACYDDMCGDYLDTALVKEARALEVEYITRMKVYDVVSRAEFKRNRRGKLIKGRWIDVNKGDSLKPDIRSRYVGKEFATGVDASLYAGTPPLKALKLIIGEASNDEQAGMHIMLSDVKRAYFHAAAERELYVEIPREDPDWSPDAIGKLNLALYGTRDAAKLWQECVAKHLVSIGFVRGKSNPCVYYNKSRKLRTLVHGDDYATVGSLEGLRWLQGQLEEAFEMKTVIAGHSGSDGVVTEAKILNRVIRAVPSGWEYECDQRHAEIILEELQLQGCKPVVTPGVEDTLKRDPVEEALGSQLLGPAAATQYRGLTARANYMSQDRADIQFAVKELCRCMSAPTKETSLNGLPGICPAGRGQSRTTLGSRAPTYWTYTRMRTGLAAKPVARVRPVGQYSGARHASRRTPRRKGLSLRVPPSPSS